MSRRVLLILPTRTYRAAAFLEAARRLELEVVVASDQASTLGRLRPGQELVIDLEDPTAAAAAAAEWAQGRSIDAVVPVDDGAVLAAAYIAERLGLRGNPVDAVAATRNKLVLRQQLKAGRASQLSWWSWPDGAVPQGIRFPAVVKPLDQAGSRGVIRVDDRAQLLHAGERIRRALAADLCRVDSQDVAPLLVEEFVAGPEVAVEGLLVNGALLVLAVYDKPEPLDGPYFEETVYTVPSELTEPQLAAVVNEVEAAIRALGLTDGPIHAELRLAGGTPIVIDLASRSIGGRCSAVLRFRSGRTLEEMLLLSALGEGPSDPGLEIGTRGVMMMPIPAAGTLRSIDGRESALGLPGIEAIELSVPIGGSVKPLPDGDRYLGFIFARGDTAHEVTAQLRAAYRELRLVVEV